MPHSINYNEDLHIVEIVVDGPFTTEDASAWSKEAAQLASQKNCHLYLSDFRQAQLKMGTVDIYDLPEILRDIISAQGIDMSQMKRALLVRGDLADYQFYEDVSANRGQLVKIFTDIDEARRWLLEDRSPADEAAQPRG